MQNLFPNKDQFDTMNVLLASIASQQGGISIKNWADVQNLVRQNLHSKAMAVADQLETTRNEKTLTFDILDFDKHTPSNKYLSHSLALGLHNVFTYGTMPFCASQLMYYTEGGLPAGNYKFTLDHAVYGGGTQYDGTYMFTLTQAIPADGGFQHTNPIGGWKNSYAQSDVLGNYITTYGARPQRNIVESSVTVSVWDGTTTCTDLGTFTARSLSYHTEDDSTNGGKRNFTERQAYGSNRWRDCVYRQWLNSDAPAVASSDNTTVSNWWKPATVFDRVPGGAKWAGFLNGLDPEFVAVLGEVEVKTALCDCDKVGGATYDITHDKVWLQSMTEIFGSNNNGIAEGSQLAYWVGASDADRIKYEGSTARYWWLRSPYPTSAVGVRGVGPSGVLDYLNAYGAGGVVPACCIMAHHPELIADAFPEMLFDERCQKVRQALSSLKPLQKQRVIKYFFDNKTTYEIAEEEGCSHQAVCKSINGALKKLKKIL